VTVRSTALALLPTPLEQSPALLPGGAGLLVKRDDLTGLGLGGNKARKLQPLCAAALEAGCDVLVTVGGSQSNHCRMTAAAGARLGLPVHLVVPEVDAHPAGNQLLMQLFGAVLHEAGSHDWDVLEARAAEVSDGLRAAGHNPAVVPIGGSTPVGASGFALAYCELLDELDALGIEASAIVHASSSGGTHAGLLAGKAMRRQAGPAAPSVLAVAVSHTRATDPALVRRLANDTLAVLGQRGEVVATDVEIDTFHVGEGYEVPTEDGDAAIRWAATHGGWVLDRTYTGKGFAGLLSHAAAGRWGTGDTVVFWHTGGHPALFTPGGAP
jgi:1-aminocyclopropane-1-carboxylate deaminase/D-cysteine desulfhydrase-like pyridoxal-dependent ACC family enzyme